MNIKKKKPIIVSMGGYAASGGYYISCAADWIVAEPTTLTGSIGIFGMFPEASELMNKKLGLHVATVKTNEHADLGLSMARPFNASESAIIQRYINNGYELFTQRCAEGRKMKQADIKAIAEGRVWTGLHAKQIGLVDQLGSLNDAIAVAEKKAKVKEYSVMEYPKNASFLENLMKEASGNSYAEAQMKAALGEYQEMFGQMKNIQSKTGIQASLPYYLRFNL
jgi:protease-4